MGRPKPSSVHVATLWVHPQRGAALAIEPISRGMSRYRGGADADWRDVARIQMVADARGYLTPVPGQTLPKGYLWGDPAKQAYGLGGPHTVYTPLHFTCRECGDPFVFTAQAQRHLYETLRAFTDVTPRYCRGCAGRRNAIERARIAYAEALAAAKASPTAATHLAVARAAIELVKCGGHAPLDKALGHCRRARRLGGSATAAKVEKQLLKLRRP